MKSGASACPLDIGFGSIEHVAATSSSHTAKFK
jgi:hypothetical protein